MALDLDYEEIFGKSNSGASLTRLSEVIPARSASSQGGGGSLLGTVVRGLLTPLTVVDTGRRGIASGIREIVDAVDGNPDTQASFQDFKDQALDPTYGIGSVFPDPTGNKWIDRIIGLAGDIALDPLTYVGFGAGKAATLTGRAAYATNLMRAAKAVDRVGEATPVIQKLTRGGINSLRSGERALFDDIVRAGRAAGVDAGSEIGQAGVRFRVPFTGKESGIIPGTTRFAETVGGGLASARSGLANTGAGSAVRRRLSPEESVELFNTMIKGGDPQTLLRQLSDFSANTRRTATEGVQGSRLTQQADEIAKQGKREGVSGEQLTREITGGNPTSDVGRRGQDFLMKEGKALGDELPEFGLREGGTYVPRVLTEVGRQLRKGDLGSELNATMGFVDDLGAESILRSRQFNEGDKIYRGEKFEVLAGDDPFSFNDAMNKLYPELGENVKFVEEDGYKLIDSWARDAASAYGRARYAKELLALGDAVPTSSVLREQSLSRQFAEQSAKTAPERAQDILVGRQGALDRATRQADDAQATLDRRVARFAEADEAGAQRLGAQSDKRVDQILERMDDQIRQFDSQIDELDARAAQIDSAVATPEEVGFMRESLRRSRAELDSARAGVGDPATDDVVEGLLSEAQRLSEQAEAMARSARNLREGGFDPRVGASQTRVARTSANRAEAQQALDAAKREGFVTNLDGVETQQSIIDDLARLPEKGHSRLKREARALTEDVPEGELLTGDEKYLQDLRQRAKTDEHAAVAHALMLDTYALEMRIAVEGGDAQRFGQFFDSVGRNKKNSVEFRTRVMNQLEDGWRQIEGTGIAVPDEIYQMRQRLLKLQEPREFNGFLKVWEEYTKLFKAYVTATPRFHVRNAMSAFFMNYSDGVTSANMARGIQIWKKYVKEGYKNLDDTERKIVDAVLGSGAGQYNPVELGYRSPYGTRWSKRAGQNVEGGVRAGVAVATVEAGGSLEEAVSRITRLHFNYSQISSVDRVARQVFPFWTFMSRNLPLQVTQMWLKPRAYSRFNSVVRNFRTDDEETGVIPGYFTEGGGFRLPFRIPGIGQWARPDLGFSRVEEDVDRLTDPIRFLADSNPVIKGLVEGFANKQLYKDIPLDDESYVPLAGWQQTLAPVLLAMGYAERKKDGTVVVTPKTEYLIDQFVPVGSLFNRYSGEGSRNEGNAFKNIFSATGLPAIPSLGGYVRDLTPDKQRSELKRRRYDQQDTIRKLQEIAKAS